MQFSEFGFSPSKVPSPVKWDPVFSPKCLPRQPPLGALLDRPETSCGKGTRCPKGARLGAVWDPSRLR